MNSSWTSEDIEKILEQLNKQNLPFKNYEIRQVDGKLDLLGKGSTANVYRAETRRKHKSRYAIKVIGFGDKLVDSDAFRESVKIQSKIDGLDSNIVTIYDSVEIYVWIEGENTVSRVEVIDPYKEEGPKHNCLKLQFVVMEEVLPVIKDANFGKLTLYPELLAKYDEEEILRLAYDIGNAISIAHNNQLIHRDIKLENIFYSVKENCYKLGDFGIARITNYGMASTVAFTKGYGAPEVVGALDDKYDNTADIYSFGMLLYVLLNELKFPESNLYRPNVMQYVRGFVPDYPMRGSGVLCDTVLKMLSFNPDDRYQSMDEVILEFDKVKYGRRVKYQREHRGIALVFGTSFALIGSILWKIGFGQEQNFDFSLLQYLFYGLCLLKGLLKVVKKKQGILSVPIFGVGLYLLFSSGFSIGHLIALLFVSFFADTLVGIIGGCALTLNLTELIISNQTLNELAVYDCRWIACLLISLSFFLVYYQWMITYDGTKVTKMYIKKDLYWYAIGLFYFGIFLLSIELVKFGYAYTLYRTYPFSLIVSDMETQTFLLSIKPAMIGIFGALFCAVWKVRELLLIHIEKKREEEYYYG